MGKFVSISLSLFLFIGLVAGKSISLAKDEDEVAKDQDAEDEVAKDQDAEDEVAKDQDAEDEITDKGFLDHIIHFLPFLTDIFTPHDKLEKDFEVEPISINSTNEGINGTTKMFSPNVELEEDGINSMNQGINGTDRNTTEVGVGNANESSSQHFPNGGQVVELYFEFDDEDDSYEVPEEKIWINKNLNFTATGECPDSVVNMAGCDINAKCILSSFDPRGYTCDCLEGYIDISTDPRRQGQVCEDEDADPQCENFCNNGGMCQMKSGEPHCRCFDHYAGTRCQIHSIVIFIIFSSILGGLAMIIMAMACFGRVRSFYMAAFYRCVGNGKQRLVEDPADISTVELNKKDSSSTTKDSSKTKLKQVHIY